MILMLCSFVYNHLFFGLKCCLEQEDLNEKTYMEMMYHWALDPPFDRHPDTMDDLIDGFEARLRAYKKKNIKIGEARRPYDLIKNHVNKKH